MMNVTTKQKALKVAAVLVVYKCVQDIFIGPM